MQTDEHSRLHIITESESFWEGLFQSLQVEFLEAFFVTGKQVTHVDTVQQDT